jgi:outer membrane protein OmpA-like peptidoglycan-associated protein/tetratricopeptide (TPR) repeat protein
MILIRFLFIVILLSGFSGANAQTIRVSDIKKKDQKKFARANEFSRFSQYAEAQDLLSELISKYPNFYEAIVLQSEAHFRSGELGLAADYMKRALDLKPEDKHQNLFTLARIFQQMVKPDSAIHYYQAYLKTNPSNKKFRAKAEKEIKTLKFLQNAIANPVDISPIKLSPNINTEVYSEYWPSFSVDGRTMYFTRGLNGQEDFYKSILNSEGTWEKAEPVNELNTPQNEGAHAISADGKMIVFTGCNRRDGMGSCDLYYALKKQDKWTKPENFGKEINTPGWEGQPTLTADGRGIYFVSNRAGGLGGKDIWYSKQNAKGQWMPPKNLGIPINSSKDDGAPFLHFDGMHLYFMSHGHQGLGEGDIFVSTNHLGQWQEPINMGYPINTPDEEGALSISPDGRYGYFARGEKSLSGITAFKKHDIYSFEIPLSLRPQPVVLIEMQIFDKATNEKIPANIDVFVPGENTIRSSFMFAPEDKMQLVTLNTEQVYGIHVNADEYLFHSEQVMFDTSYARETHQMIVKLEKIPMPELDFKMSEPIVLQNVFFKTGSSKLDQKSFFELDRLVKLLTGQPNLKIEIRGHTDNVGSSELNQNLSTERAKSVYTYLVEQGIEPVRLSYIGFGMDLPVESNDTPEGRQENRRTEFLILE